MSCACVPPAPSNARAAAKAVSVSPSPPSASVPARPGDFSSSGERAAPPPTLDGPERPRRGPRPDVPQPPMPGRTSRARRDRRRPSEGAAAPSLEKRQWRVAFGWCRADVAPRREHLGSAPSRHCQFVSQRRLPPGSPPNAERYPRARPGSTTAFSHGGTSTASGGASNMCGPYRPSSRVERCLAPPPPATDRGDGTRGRIGVTSTG